MKLPELQAIADLGHNAAFQCFVDDIHEGLAEVERQMETSPGQNEALLLMAEWKAYRKILRGISDKLSNAADKLGDLLNENPQYAALLDMGRAQDIDCE